jgi:uncharacterized protein (TIGR02118 family)
MIRISVLYPNADGRFDFEYYTKKHIPLMHTLLDPFGLVKTEVDKGIGTAKPGAPAPFIAVGHMVFNNIENMKKGLQAHDPQLAADMVNFTDIKPQFQISEVID